MYVLKKQIVDVTSFSLWACSMVPFPYIQIL